MMSLLFTTALMAAAPATLPVQGLLSDAEGTPVTEAVDVTFALYAEETGGSALFTETQRVTPNAGIFTAYLGAVETLDLSLFAVNSALYLGITIEGEAEMTPRVQIGTTPFAAYAQHCGEVGWANVVGAPADLTDGDDDTLGGLSCANGQVATFDGTDWTCGTITVPAYSAGAGLNLDRSTFEAVVDRGLSIDTRSNAIGIDVAGVGSPQIADGSIADRDIASGAAIAPSKIAGTAATLSGSQGFDGNTLHIDATNNRVGVNNPSPSVSFDVVGAVEVTGVFRYATPKTYTAVVSGAEFRKTNENDTDVWHRDYNYGGITSCDAACRIDAQAPLRLPHGATVTALTCKYRDGGNTKMIEDLDFYLVRIHHDTAVTYTMASVTNIWTARAPPAPSSRATRRSATRRSTTRTTPT